MPRQDRITSADSTIRCPQCRGLGQVENISLTPTENQLMACPLCEGIGRILPGGGNQRALASYLRIKAIRDKTL